MTTPEKITELERRFDERDESTPTDVSKEGRQIFIWAEESWQPINRNEMADTLGDKKANTIWNWARP